MSMSISEFMERYSDEEACLRYVLDKKYPAFKCVCGRRKLYKVKGRPVFACACGKQINPLAGTHMANTKVPLTYWFYVTYVMTNSKSGVAAAELQRHLGVKYETVWRMMMKIREVMEDEEPLTGVVEADETYLRAKPWRTVRPLAYNGRAQTVFGMVERGGRARAVVLPTNSTKFISDAVRAHASRDSILHTDGAYAYVLVGREYKEHHVVLHGQGQYVDGNNYTNNIENFWGGVKRGIYGVHRVVHPEYLQQYLNYYAWVYSHRFASEPLFDLFWVRALR